MKLPKDGQSTIIVSAQRAHSHWLTTECGKCSGNGQREDILENRINGSNGGTGIPKLTGNGFSGQISRCCFRWVICPLLEFPHLTEPKTHISTRNISRDVDINIRSCERGYMPEVQLRVVDTTRYRCVSGMRWKSHVPFFGEGCAVMSIPYPTFCTKVSSAGDI